MKATYIEGEFNKSIIIDQEHHAAMIIVAEGSPLYEYLIPKIVQIQRDQYMGYKFKNSCEVTQAAPENGKTYDIQL